MADRLRRGVSKRLRFRTAALFTALIFASLVVTQEGMAQSATPSPPPNTSDQTPLTSRERALLERIQKLEERLNAVEQKVTPAPGADPLPNAAPSPADQPDTAAADSKPGMKSMDSGDSDDDSDNNSNKSYGRYTPYFGFKVVNTEYGDMNVSIYTYARYLNQRGLASTYTDAFGNINSVKERQDFQLNKVQIKFLGWIINPKLRYFIYAWTSNANQGLGAQVVLAGNLNYTFNKHLTFSAGITGLPGTRSIEGNFPFWLGVDSRMIADEFFRASYTSGIWARGAITDKLKYQVMLGNNMSTLGVPAARLDNKFNTLASALIWHPTVPYGDGFGDFEDHQKLAIRLATHYSRSDENKESQPGSDDFENTQLRLSDGTVIFTPNIFGTPISVTDARYQMANFDWGFKYRGYSLEGAYYARWLDNFRGDGTEGIPRVFNQGYQVEAAAMLVPKKLQLYAGYSKIFGKQGNPWDFRMGLNFFPWKNKVVRWNNELLYLHGSPVGYTSVPFALGGKGWVFHSTWELAF